MTLHALLEHQLLRAGGSPTAPPADEWASFLREVAATYFEADRTIEGLREAAARAHDSVSEQRMHAVLRALPDLIFLCDVEGHIRDFHAANHNELYTVPEAFLGRRLDEILPPEAAQPLRAAIGETLISGQTRSVRYPLPMPTGVRTYEARLVVSGPELCLVLVRDLTDQLQMEERLAAAERHAQLSTVTARMAQEIATPLTVVLANMAVVEEDLQRRTMRDPSPENRETLLALAEALEGINRVNTIVQDLTRATIRAPEPENTGRVDVHRCLDDALQLVAGELRPRATVIRRYGTGLPMVEAHEGRLVQLFVALLANAAQATGDRADGPQYVRITTGLDLSGGLPRVRIDVEDTGMGIAPDILPRVFEPFFTTRGDDGHTGMGLAIALSISRALGGELKLTSQIGQGTRSRLVLPAASPDAAASISSVDGFDFGAPLRRARILVVDDEPRILSALTRVLSPHEVVALSSGAEATARLEAGERFDLVLIDLFMPDVTGMEVFERVRPKRPELSSRIVAMTGGSQTARARDFLDRELLPVLEKPFDAAQVRALVARYLGD